MTGRVFVVGSVNVDMVVSLPRIPCAGETALGRAFSQVQGGKGANQAVAAARLGRRVSLVAAVGSDAMGQEALADLEREGVDIGGVAKAQASTGVALILVGDDGENMIAVAPGANWTLTGTSVERCLVAVRPADVVVANLEVPDEAVLAAARVARSRGAIFVLNPAPARQLTSELLAHCDFVTPNILEVAALGFASVPDLQKTGVGTVVVTKGSLGADVYPSHEAAFHQEAFSVTVVDTTGAGDAFTAGLASALSTGSDLREAVRWAAATGGLATQGLGARTAYPTTDEVARALSDETAGRQSKIPSDAS